MLCPTLAESFMNPLESPWMPHLTVSLIFQHMFPIFIASIVFYSDSMQIFWCNYVSPCLQDLFPSDLLAGQERKGTMQDLNYLVQKIQRDLLFSCVLTVPFQVGISEEGSCYRDLFPTLFLGTSYKVSLEGTNGPLGQAFFCQWP